MEQIKIETVTNSNRLEQLLKYLEEDTNDPFTLYAIAMEYIKTDPGTSRDYFEKLLDTHPNYLATYYQVGHLYEALGEDDLAIKAYNKGILVAQDQGNQTTLRELKNALDDLEF
uniref:tetratricopeptide repeat protein n=1 Tax=Fulvivirga sp. TaxID=1931237 RepID=UPI00404A75AC